MLLIEKASRGGGALGRRFLRIRSDDAGKLAKGLRDALDQVKVADIAIHVLEALENGDRAAAAEAPLAGSVGE